MKWRCDIRNTRSAEDILADLQRTLEVAREEESKGRVECPDDEAEAAEERGTEVPGSADRGQGLLFG